MVEGDAKVCTETITAAPDAIPWKIMSVITNINVLALQFSICSFC